MKERVELNFDIQSVQSELKRISTQFYVQQDQARNEELTATVESKRRLAQIRVRRELLDVEIKVLSAKAAELRRLADRQWLIELQRKDLESLQSRLAPLQFRKLEVDAIISAVEEK